MSGPAANWREEIMQLANRYYDAGHVTERRASELGRDAAAKAAVLFAQADVYQQVYADLCGLVAQVDPRPGGGGAPARPW